MDTSQQGRPRDTIAIAGKQNRGHARRIRRHGRSRCTARSSVRASPIRDRSGTQSSATSPFMSVFTAITRRTPMAAPRVAVPMRQLDVLKSSLATNHRFDLRSLR